MDKLFGIDTVDVIVKPLELFNYCNENGLEINGRSRAEFVTRKLENNERK